MSSRTTRAFHHAANARLRARIVPSLTDNNSHPTQLTLFHETPDYLDGSKYRLR